MLVNNAGWELNKTYDETEEDEWYRVIDTDLKGPWLMCKHFVPPMVKAGRGSVINISSLNGIVGFPLSTAYGSAKGGLVLFTKDMAIELAKSGVRVNCVCPGVIDTAMMERWTDLMPDKGEAKKMLTEVMPIGRMGTADEVAGAILFCIGRFSIVPGISSYVRRRIYSSIIILLKSRSKKAITPSSIWDPLLFSFGGLDER